MCWPQAELRVKLKPKFLVAYNLTQTYVQNCISNVRYGQILDGCNCLTETVRPSYWSAFVFIVLKNADTFKQIILLDPKKILML